jgi:RNA polymerase sigma-70 factor (ECF subfamily)
MHAIGPSSLRTRVTARRTDEELIAAARDGAPVAFGDLTTRYRREVERWCRRFFADRELIQDLTQESFIRAFAALETYRLDLPFRAWMRTITVNVCYDELRRRVRRPEKLIDDPQQAEQMWLQLVNEASPETILQAAEESAAAEALARRLLDGLRPDDRVVMMLKESEELSVAEIANVMGWSEAKVKIRTFRARRLMKRIAERALSLGRRR